MNKINLLEKFDKVNEYWKPCIIGELNEQHVKIVKLKGAFIWHQHENEDELFMVIKGILKMELRKETIVLNEGEIFIVPKGIEHKPVADEEVWVMLFEPSTTINTGGERDERTRLTLDKI